MAQQARGCALTAGGGRSARKMPLYRPVAQWPPGLWLLVLCLLLLPAGLQPRPFPTTLGAAAPRTAGVGRSRGAMAWPCAGTPGRGMSSLPGRRPCCPFPSELAHTISIHPHSPEALEQAVMQTSTVSKMETEDTIHKSFPKGYDNGLLINRGG